MSRLGKKPIIIPEGVQVKFENGILTAKGPKGEISRVFKDDIVIFVDQDKIILKLNEAKKFRHAKEVSALWGTYASHIRNMIKGAVEGFSKILIVEGIGYKAQKEGENLVLSLGFSHLIKVPIPPKIDLKTEKNTIMIFGVDKEKVGGFASKIRALKKPEPYKGKGIRYQGELVRHKAGKKAVASSV